MFKVLIHTINISASDSEVRPKTSKNRCDYWTVRDTICSKLKNKAAGFYANVLLYWLKCFNMFLKFRVIRVNTATEELCISEQNMLRLTKHQMMNSSTVDFFMEWVTRWMWFWQPNQCTCQSIKIDLANESVPEYLFKWQFRHELWKEQLTVPYFKF